MESINESFNGKDLFREKMQTILNDYKITLKTLSKVTQIDYLWLTDYVNGKKNGNNLSMISTSWQQQLYFYIIYLRTHLVLKKKMTNKNGLVHPLHNSKHGLSGGMY